MNMLTLNEVHAAYGHIRATHGISFVVGEGETVALIGSNGAGKSSTLKAIMGLASVAKGEIRLGDRSLRGLRAPDIVRLGIGFSPEGRRVFPQSTVHENLLAGGYTLGGRAMKSRLEWAYSHFPLLRERARQAAGSLSGGQQQMLAIARALMPKPKILLLDEPSLGLAPVMVQHIGDIVREISCEGISIILAEQNATWAMSLATNAVILELGRVVMQGPPSKLKNEPSIQRAYLGR